MSHTTTLLLLLLGTAAAASAQASSCCVGPAGFSTSLVVQDTESQTLEVLSVDKGSNTSRITVNQQFSNGTVTNAVVYYSKDSSGDYRQTFTLAQFPGKCFVQLVPRPGLFDPICFSSKDAVSHERFGSVAVTSYSQAPGTAAPGGGARYGSWIAVEDSTCTPMAATTILEGGTQQLITYYNQSTSAPGPIEVPQNCTPITGREVWAAVAPHAGEPRAVSGMRVGAAAKV